MACLRLAEQSACPAAPKKPSAHSKKRPAPLREPIRYVHSCVQLLSAARLPPCMPCNHWVACRRSTRQRRDVDYTEEQHGSQPEATVGVHYQEVGPPAVHSSCKQAVLCIQRSKMRSSSCHSSHLEACLQLSASLPQPVPQGPSSCVEQRVLSVQAAVWSSSCLLSAEHSCVGAPAEVNRDPQPSLPASSR